MRQLISDYLHILHKYLNQDNIKTGESNTQFKLMYSILYKWWTKIIYVAMWINVDQIFQRNNRQRETQNIGSKFSSDKKAIRNI